jgi:hypothetical protein
MARQVGEAVRLVAEGSPYLPSWQEQDRNFASVYSVWSVVKNGLDAVAELELVVES